MKVPGAFVFDTLTILRSLTEADLLCSVPMMKTHQLATVTLGKNLAATVMGFEPKEVPVFEWAGKAA